MKNTIFLLSLLFCLISCGVKVPFTNELRDEFSLDSDEKMRSVQFSTSHTIILDQELESDSQNTTTNGTWWLMTYPLPMIKKSTFFYSIISAALNGATNTIS